MTVITAEQPGLILAKQILSDREDKDAENYILLAVELLGKSGVNEYDFTKFINNVVTRPASLPSSEMSYDQWSIVRRASLNLQQIRNAPHS